jgi:hypothetical protein
VWLAWHARWQHYPDTIDTVSDCMICTYSLLSIDIPTSCLVDDVVVCVTESPANPCCGWWVEDGPWPVLDDAVRWPWLPWSGPWFGRSHGVTFLLIPHNFVKSSKYCNTFQWRPVIINFTAGSWPNRHFIAWLNEIKYIFQAMFIFQIQGLKIKLNNGSGKTTDEFWNVYECVVFKMTDSG